MQSTIQAPGNEPDVPQEGTFGPAQLAVAAVQAGAALAALNSLGGSVHVSEAPADVALTFFDARKAVIRLLEALRKQGSPTATALLIPQASLAGIVQCACCGRYSERAAWLGDDHLVIPVCGACLRDIPAGVS